MELFNAIQYLKGKNAPMIQEKKKTANIYRLLTKLEAATSYISY